MSLLPAAWRHHWSNWKVLVVLVLCALVSVLQVPALPVTVLAWLLIALGLWALIVGGEVVVDSGTDVGIHLKFPAFIVGVVIAGFGTSLPEAITALLSTLAGAPDLAMGNIVGSNIANIGLIFALGLLLLAVFTRADTSPLKLKMGMSDSKLDYIAMVVVSVLFAVLAAGYGWLNMPVSLLLLAVMGGYLWMSFKLNIATIERSANDGLPLALLRVLGSLAVLMLGANLLIDGATTVATQLSIPEQIIGLTIVAVGTSLPELAVTITAARKGQGSMILGNVLGSNIFNLLVASSFAGVGTLWAGAIPLAGVVPLMLPMLLFALAMGLLLLPIRHKNAGVWIAAALLVFYVGYMTLYAITSM